MTIVSEIQSLSQSATVPLFILSGYNPESPNEVFRFTNHVGARFDGFLYTPLACGIDKVKLSSEGTQPELGLQIADGNGAITKLLSEYTFIEGSNIRMLVTKKRYLDGEALGSGSVEDRTLLDINMQISRIQSWEPKHGVLFILGNPIDVEGIQLPGRLALRKCTWTYRGSECGYTGNAKFTKQGNNTSNEKLDACGKEISNCDVRGNTLRYGGFPGLKRR